MKISDFRTDDTFAYTGSFEVWGEDTDFSIDFGEQKEEPAKLLEKYLPQIEEKIEWLRTHKEEILTRLIEGEDILSLAEDWASSAEEAEDEEQECYIMEDGQKVFLPITREDFVRSLSCSATIFCEAEDCVWMEMFLACSPDYFAGHAIEMSLDTDGELDYGSLWG